MGKLEGKVAVITGATSGMALATARRFVMEGAYVFVTGRRQEQLDAAVNEIGRNVTGVQGDAGNLADLDRLYETVKDDCPPAYASTWAAYREIIPALGRQWRDPSYYVKRELPAQRPAMASMGRGR